MTILNVFVERDRALVAVDTLGQNADGSRKQIGKMMLLPHLSGVAACRGHFAFAMIVWWSLVQHIGDFDKLVEEAAAICEGAHRLFKHYLAESKAALDARFGNGDEQYIVLVGWSVRQKSMVAHEFRRSEGDERFLSSEIESTYIAPSTEDLAAAHPRPNSGESMEALFRSQQALYERDAPHATPGGLLIVAEIGPGHTRTWSQCEIQTQEDLRASRICA